MTIVCAITDRVHTWIGSDRQTTIGGDLAVPLRDGKWQALPSGWWVGVSGWARLETLIASCTERSYDPLGLAMRARALIQADGWEKEDCGAGPEQHGISMLLAKPGEVWSVDSSWHVVRRPDHELAAIGVGSAVAHGADYALRVSSGYASRVKVAIEAACAYEPNCGHGVWTRKLTGG
jgi:ATP-dependent protease HslVU (ClpYQ) peptidase subunit